MSEVNKVKLTPNEIRTAKHAVAAEKILALANRSMLAAEQAAAEARQILEAKQIIATQKEETANKARAAYAAAAEQKVLNRKCWPNRR